MNKIAFNINDIFAGILSGLMLVVIAAAFAALVFTGPLILYFSIGITSALIGSIIVNLLSASFSSFRMAIGRADPTPGAVLGIIFANIAKAHLPPEILLPTLLATISVASLMIGAAMFAIGFFRGGQIARFLPYPVLGGVIAGTAWIMARGSFDMMINNNMTLENILQTRVLAQCMTVIGFAVFLIYMQKKHDRSWLLPATLLVTSVLINLILQMKHIPHLEAIHSGWLFSSFTPTFTLASMDASFFNRIDWPTIFSQLNYLLSLVGVVIILLLLNVSSLETTVKAKADLDRELKVSGAGNMLAALANGATANLSFAGTLMNKDIGAVGRLSGLSATLTSLIVLFFCPSIVSYLPKPIIAGLLLFIAFRLLIQWLYEARKKLPLVDYLIVISILITVAISGFLSGVGIGIIITSVVFIVRYARIDVIQFATTGANYRSNVIRPVYEQKWLAENGSGIQLFKLHGYLFFGSAKLLLDKITQLIEQDVKKEFQFLIFDFQLVHGVDSSASFSFIRLQQLIDSSRLQLVFTHCSEKLIDQFKQEKVIEENSRRIIILPDLDQGMEYCENKMLQQIPDQLRSARSELQHSLSQLIPDLNQRAIFVTFLEKIYIEKNSYLFKKDNYSDCLYFIDEGEVEVFLEGQASLFRVSKSGPGTIVGEIGFYLNGPRTASVRAETACIIYKLTKSALIELEKGHPEIALVFHKNIINTLALRIMQTNYELQLVSH